MTTLREVTADHTQDMLDGMEGTVRRRRATALCSLFRALKRERLVFRDLDRHLPVGDLTNIPRPAPSDVLVGLFSFVHFKGFWLSFRAVATVSDD
ncbi:hypothetical protein [Streptomyces sp. NPDC001787]|uniref:hypothetical protein n=1 Tax=Streptomyces sp. NPDC001787 TaxID=3154523 RepID=UPI00331F8BED